MLVCRQFLVFVLVCVFFFVLFPPPSAFVCEEACVERRRVGKSDICAITTAPCAWSRVHLLRLRAAKEGRGGLPMQHIARR